MYHVQEMRPDWARPIPGLPHNTLVKTVGQGGVFREVKGLNPNIVTCLRHHYDEGQHFGGGWDANVQRARIFLPTFIDGTFKTDIAPWCDYIEGFNEYLANSQNEQERLDRITWARALAWVWANDYRTQPEYAHIGLVICNAAVGNWIDRRFAEITREYPFVAIGYHPYDYWNRKVRGDEGFIAATSMLWDTMEYDWGIDVTWVFTEAGPFESAVTGWRSDECLGHDQDLYVEAMRTWIRDVQQTPAYTEGRIRGFGLFTTGRTSNGIWKGFYTEQPEIDALAEMIIEEWHPGIKPPDPPLPPSNDFALKLWADSLTKQTMSYNPEAALQKVIFRDGFVPVMNESRFDYDITRYAEQAAEHLDTGERRVYYCVVDDWDNVKYINSPSGGGEEPELFKFDVLPIGGPFTITQKFGENPEDYDQFGLPGHDGVDFAAPEGTPVLLPAPGRVYRVHKMDVDGYHNYGNHVRAEHVDGYKTIFGHLSEIPPDVEVGDYIESGAWIGFVGNTGNSFGNHLHLAMKRPPGAQGWPYDLIDPWPFMQHLV